VTSRVVHLEVHTPNLGAACAFYGRLLEWRPQRIRAADASYESLDLAPDLSGGIVECGTERALWLPYVEVRSVKAATAQGGDARRR
jgi:predicted enzyme related to lactoylglutathione lyase